jgi:hypothetical protein
MSEKKYQIIPFSNYQIEKFVYLCTLKYLTGTSSRKIQTLCQ